MKFSFCDFENVFGGKRQLLGTIKNKMSEVKWLEISLNQDMSVESG